MESVARFFQEGGQFMWIILGVGAFAFAVFMERVVFYFWICRRSGAKSLLDIAEFIKGKDYLGAAKSISGSSPLQRLLKATLVSIDNSADQNELESKIEEASIKQIPRLKKRLASLGMFANVSTLMGLLGTIFGLQESFSSLKLADGAEKASALADGIAQAMNTTAMGLIVAIPCMIFYTQLNAKQSKLVDDIDETLLKLLNQAKGN